jgi:serpin B
MPKFEYEVKNALTEVLKEMGMVQAFDPYGAEFQPMIDLRDENVYIGNIFQHTKIINDEKGTEAAAATVVENEATSAEFEEQPINFHMNKPFIYVIEENVSGVPMFMGIVYKP